jgi:hypothetical protein
MVMSSSPMTTLMDPTDGPYNALVADSLPPHPMLLDEYPLPATTKEHLLSNIIHDFKEATHNARKAEWDALPKIYGTYLQGISFHKKKNHLTKFLNSSNGDST